MSKLNISESDAEQNIAQQRQKDAEQKLWQQRQKELSAPRINELKEASLKFLDQWRTKVIERVGEVLNSKHAAKTQAEAVNAPSSKTQAPGDSKIDAADHNTSGNEADSTLAKLFPPIDTPLSDLPEQSRILIMNSTLLLLLSLEHYYAPSRVLLLHLITSLRLPLKVLVNDEEKVAKGLLEAAKQMSGDSETQKKINESKDSRKWKVGLASVAGAALIGVTGGLAAPLVAAGFGTLMGGLGLGATAAAGYLGTVAGSTVIVGGLFGAYGGRMTGKMMDEYAREVEDFAFLPMRDHPIENDSQTKGGSNDAKQSPAVQGKPQSDVSKGLASRPESMHGEASNVPDKKSPGVPAEVDSSTKQRLRVTIAISGWLTSKNEIVSPWRVLGHNSEVFALRWELDALMNLGNSLDTMISHAAWGYAKTEIIHQTILAELMLAAAWPLALLKISRIVDNPFSIAKFRADKAGEVLADALINKAQGERPVTLIGYSLGARVIFSCLTSLARRRAFGLVESAVLIGAPTPATTADWRLLRSVVAGRLVNVFSTNDYILGFLYRTSSIQYGVAGLQKVEGIRSVENIDVSETVTGHLRYRYLVGSILMKIGFQDVDLSAIKSEEVAFKKMLEEEKKKSYADTAVESGQMVLEHNPLGIGAHHDATESPKAAKQIQDQEKKVDPSEAEVQRLEQQVKEKTKQGMS